VALAPKTTYWGGGAPLVASVSAKEKSPNQSSPVVATAGFGTSRLAAMFGNNGFGAKPL